MKRWLIGLGTVVIVAFVVVLVITLMSLATDTNTATLDEHGDLIGGPTVVAEAPQR